MFECVYLCLRCALEHMLVFVHTATFLGYWCKSSFPLSKMHETCLNIADVKVKR